MQVGDTVTINHPLLGDADGQAATIEQVLGAQGPNPPAATLSLVLALVSDPSVKVSVTGDRVIP